MYNNEEEISSNRKTLIIIIVSIVVVITALVIIILVKALGGGSSSKKNDGGNGNEKLGTLGCELEVAEGIVPAADGTYGEEVEVQFKNISMVSSNYRLLKNTIGRTDSRTNTDTFRASIPGTYTVYGYLVDSKGNEATCSLDFTIKTDDPTCELEVTNGTLGENGWYTSEVEVEFKDLDPSITNFYIEKAEEDTDSPRVGNLGKYKVTEDGETRLIGHITNSAGRTGKCSAVIKKDVTNPTCTLRVKDGTLNGDGAYINNPVVELDTALDNAGELRLRGVGLTQNYDNDTYTIKEVGEHTIYGFVKDEAGNEFTCSLVVKKAEGGSQQQDPGNGGGGGGGSQQRESAPYCYLQIYSINLGDNKYKGRTSVYFLEYSSNVTSYGIGVIPKTITPNEFANRQSEIFNGKKTYEISKPGAYHITGWVKNKSGDIAYCETPDFTVTK